MELSQAHLRYLLAIGELSQGKAAVSSTQVARVLQVSRPSVTRMLAVLAEKDLVTKERYGKITLTETGAALAHQLQAGLRDLEPAAARPWAWTLDREETAAVAGAWPQSCRSTVSESSARPNPAGQWDVPRLKKAVLRLLPQDCLFS